MTDHALVHVVVPFVVGRAADHTAVRIDETFADQPEVRAEVLATVGNTYRKLSRWDQAEKLLLSAIEIRRGLPDADPVSQCGAAMTQ